MTDRVLNGRFLRVCFVSLLLQTGNQIIMAVLPLFLDANGFAPTLLGTATALSALASMFARPVFGWFADRRSKRLAACFGLLLMLLGMLLLTLSPVAAVIVLIRAAQGFGVSGTETAQTALAADALPKDKIKRGMPYFGIVNTIAGASGSAIGLALVFGSNYAPVWLFGAALFGVAALVSLTLREEKSPAPRDQARETGGVWRYFEKSARFPAAIQMLMMAAGSAFAFFPSYGASAGVSLGLFFALQWFMAFGASMVAGRRVEKARAPKMLLLPGALCCMAAFSLLFLTGGGAFFYIAAALYGFGDALCMATVSATAMAAAPLDRRGATAATFQCAGDIGYCVGSLFFGLLAARLGYRALYGAAFALPALAFALIALWRRKKNA